MFIAPPAAPARGRARQPAGATRLTRVSRRGRGRLALGDGQLARRAGPAHEAGALHLHDGCSARRRRADHERPELRGRAAVPLRRLRAARARGARRARSTPGRRRKGLYSTAPDCPAFSADNAFRGYAVPVLLERAGLELRDLVGAARARRVASRTKEAPLRDRFARAWTQWTASHLTLGLADGRRALPPRDRPPVPLIPDYFHSAWLDTFFRGVVVDGLVDVGPLRLDGVPWKDERDQLGARRAWRACDERRGSRRSSPPR